MQHPIEFLRTEPHYHPFPPRDVGRVSPMFGKQWSEDIDFMLIDRVFLFLVWSKPEHGDCPGGDELDELFQTVSKSWWKATSRWVPSTSASSQSDLSSLVTQIDEHEQPEKTNLSPQPWELEADTAPSPESLGPGTDTALSPQSTIALPQSLELGTIYGRRTFLITASMPNPPWRARSITSLQSGLDQELTTCLPKRRSAAGRAGSSTQTLRCTWIA